MDREEKQKCEVAEMGRVQTGEPDADFKLRGLQSGPYCHLLVVSSRVLGTVDSRRGAPRLRLRTFEPESVLQVPMSVSMSVSVSAAFRPPAAVTVTVTVTVRVEEPASARALAGLLLPCALVLRACCPCLTLYEPEVLFTEWRCHRPRQDPISASSESQLYAKGAQA